MILLAHSYFLARDPKQHDRMRPYPPLATLLAAAQLRRDGHDVALFDAMLADGVDDFRAALVAHRPAAVAIVEDNFNYVTKMCTVRMREAALEMIAAARARGAIVLVNGSDASDRPALYLDAGAAAVLVGEPDETLRAVAARLALGAPFDAVPGLVTGDGRSGIRTTGPAPTVRDLDALPEPAWDLVDIGAYRAAWVIAHGRLSWSMTTSRGCPFGCNWCAKPIFGRRYAQRSPELVAHDLRNLKDVAAPDHVWFADDIFGLTPRWIARFADEVQRLDARIPFMIQTRVDLLQPSVVRALVKAGAEEVWMGVESGSQRVLDAMEKGTVIDDVRAATRALRDHGVRACWFLQLGYPPEEWADVLMTRDLVRDERPDDIGVSVAYPLPGTKFHAEVRAQLGVRENWEHSDDLAMLFHGTYTTAFYRRIRDALHHEVDTGATDHARWGELAREERFHRSLPPLAAAGA